MKKIKIAIITDWLTSFGGAERVISSFAKIFPTASIFTTVFVPDKLNQLQNFFPRIKTSNLQKLPKFIRKKHPFLFPFLPGAVENFDFSDFDVLLSSSSFVSKFAISNPNQLHICFCHSPPRYLWENWQQYLKDFPIPKIFKNFLPSLFSKFRVWDYFAAQRPDKIIANSKFIAQQIKKFYRRDIDEIISPPVNFDYFSTGINFEKKNYFVAVARLVPQKKIEILIDAFLKMPTENLKIVGDGYLKKKLISRSNNAKNIQFLGQVSEKKLPQILGSARAFFHPQIEDAGISILESLSAGTPIIGFNRGGILTISEKNKIGVLFDKQSVSKIISAIFEFKKIEKSFNRKNLQTIAEKFSSQNFEKKISQFIEKSFCKFRKSL